MATDRMYELAFQFRNKKLWNQLADTELYAVAFPDGEIAYCSVMGAIRQHLALGVYVGQSGYASFCCLLDHVSDGDLASERTELLAGQDCIQCSFEEKDMLSDEELAEVRAYCRKIGKNLRGKNAFPQFKKYVPGQYPWHFDSKADEDRMCEALEASIWLATALKKHTKEEIRLFELQRDGEILLLVKKNSDWQVQYTVLPDPERVWPTPILENEVLIARIRSMRKEAVWESGTFYLPSPVQSEEDDEEEAGNTPKTAPYYPLLLLSADRNTGMVTRPVMGSMQNPEELVRELAEGMVADQTAPKSILIGDDRGFSLLADFCGRTGIRLRREEKLPAFTEAKQSLLQEFDGNDGWDEEDGWDDGEDLPFGEDREEELDQFFDTLMKMRDEELEKMPEDLVKIIRGMAEWGLVPEALMIRLKKLFR